MYERTPRRLDFRVLILPAGPAFGYDTLPAMAQAYMPCLRAKKSLALYDRRLNMLKVAGSGA